MVTEKCLDCRNPAWVSNPCCNPALALTTCCAPQDVPSGSIPVVKGFNTTLVSSFCAGTPANTISSYLNGAYATLQANQASISAINAAMNAVSWATLSSIQQVCLATIHGATSLACYSDLDCGAAICSKSTCLKNPATGAGTCSVPYDAMNRCMAECFGANMDPDVVRFAKAQWGLSPLSSASALATAFSTHASVPQCVGTCSLRRCISDIILLDRCRTVRNAARHWHDPPSVRLQHHVPNGQFVR